MSESENTTHRVVASIGLTSRLGAEYFLETSRVFGGVVPGDTLTTLVFLTIVSRNLKAVEGDGASMFAGDIPDTLRAPVTVYAVAKDLGLSYETVRRHVRRLVDSGVCERGGAGLVVPASVFNRPEFVRALARNHENVQRLMRSLQDL
ncbi:MAG TPA: hypothetical protein VG939_19380 [Caulobacteraceae bacterium]|nr:hypothetical protein [Caulobacteraceae bacterium]